jgi:uncharacterized protein YfkK (UPF0435 family)
MKFIYHLLLFFLPTFPASVEAQSGSSYLFFEKSYVSPFAEEESMVEMTIYSLVKELAAIYRKGCNLLSSSSGLNEKEREEFTALFQRGAKHPADFNNSKLMLGIEEYANKAESAYLSQTGKARINAISIANIEKLESGTDFFVHVNIHKSHLTFDKTPAEAPAIAMNALVRVSTSEENSRAIIAKMEHGFWEREVLAVLPIKRWSSLYALGGHTLYLSDQVSEGFVNRNQYTAGLGLQTIQNTGLMRGRFSLLGGVQIKYQNSRVRAREGTRLSNSGSPNQLEINFLTQGEEQIQMLGFEALAGFDIRLGKDLFKHWGLSLAFTPRLATFHASRFKGALGYQEIWDNRVVVSEVINCGLRNFEGEEAAHVVLNGRLGGLQPGILVRPYFKNAAARGMKFHLALDLQFFPGSTIEEGNPIFMGSFNANLEDIPSRLIYQNNTLFQGVNRNLQELYMGLSLSYLLGGTKIETFRLWENQDVMPMEGQDDFLEDGKSILVLSGNISDAQAAVRIKNELGPATQSIWVINTTQLKDVVIPSSSELVNVRIENNRDLENINFTDLRQVYEKISIRDNLSLRALEMPSLIEINEFEFQKNASISVFQMEQLKVINTNLTLSRNDSLHTVLLPGLSEIQGSLGFYENAVLKRVGLPELKTTQGSFTLFSNNQMDTFSLPQLHWIGGSLDFTQNKILRELDLPKLGKVATSLEVSGNDQLERLSLEKLSEIGKNINLFNNKVLKEIDLPALLGVSAELQIAYNNQLEKVFLERLKRVGETLNISNSSELQSIHFPALQTIGGNLTLFNNPRMKDLMLDSLDSVEGMIQLYDSKLTLLSLPSLERLGMLNATENSYLLSLEFPSLRKIEQYTLEGDNYQNYSIWLERNYVLGNIMMPKVDSVKGNVYVGYHPKLEALSLQSLVFLKGGLSLRENEKLKKVDFSSVKEINSSLEISRNASLSALLFDQLNKIEGNVEITYNPSAKQVAWPQLKVIAGNVDLGHNSFSVGFLSSVLQVLAGSSPKPNSFVNLKNQIPRANLGGGVKSTVNRLNNNGVEVFHD